MKKKLSACFICLILLAGCGGSLSNTKEERSPDELAAIGMREFKNENYKKAINAFENLRDWYPFSELAELAELKIGDSYFMKKEYPEAIAAYESFKELHPKNRAVPHVLYRIGLSYYSQIRTVDRDQEATKLAIETFRKLDRDFPDHKYKKVRQYIRTCRADMAEKIYYIGFHYFKDKRYKAAIKRFESILKDHRDISEVLGKTRHYLNLSKGMLKMTEDEAAAKKRMREDKVEKKEAKTKTITVERIFHDSIIESSGS